MIILEKICLPETCNPVQAMSNTVLLQAYLMNQHMTESGVLDESEFDVLRCSVGWLEYAINLEKSSKICVEKEK